jgi:hypothetical protein
MANSNSNVKINRITVKTKVRSRATPKTEPAKSTVELQVPIVPVAETPVPDKLSIEAEPMRSESANVAATESALQRFLKRLVKIFKK